MRTKSSGFTLLEILIVLVVIQLIWFISLYTYNNQTNKYKFESWYQQFELDLLYLQIHTMTTSNRYVLQFNPDKNYYAIRSSPVIPAIEHRDIPSDWNVSMLTLGNPISFTDTGQIRRPGTMKIEFDNETYYIYFPFGKGRCYYAKVE